MEWDRILVETGSHTAEFIGLGLDEARALATRLGVELRVMTPGLDFMTADLRLRRITIWVDDSGRVHEASAG